MTFTSRLAKLGKAQLVNCNQISSEPLAFNVYLSKNGITQKTLNFSDDNYSLSKTLKTLNYTEVVGINQNYILARIGNKFSIIKV